MIEKRLSLWCLLVLVCTVIAAVVVGWWWTSRPVTTVLLVRHAEKDEQADGTPLSDEGHARAQTLAHVVGEAGVTAVFATEYLRNQQTAQPLATYLGRPVQQVDATDVEGLVDTVLSNHAGEVVLIVGHTATVPATIEEFGGGPVRPIDDDEYDDLFIVAVRRFGRTQTVRLNYGSP